MVTVGLIRDRIASPQPTQFSKPIPAQFHLSFPWTLEVFVYLKSAVHRQDLFVIPDRMVHKRHGPEPLVEFRAVRSTEDPTA